MGTTGHPVGYYEMDTTEKVKEWLKRQYTWSEWKVEDLAQGTKHRSNWWMVMREVATDRRMAVVVYTTNRAKGEGYFYTKEVGEDMGPYSTDIPKRLFRMLTPLREDQTYAQEWRDKVSSGVVRG